MEEIAIKIMDEVIKLDIPKGYEFCGVEFDSGKILIRKKSIKYPKTYVDCKGILPFANGRRIARMLHIDYAITLDNLSELLLCRDAYWKIYGEEMGLDEPWRPDWTTSGQERYTIETNYDKFIFSKTKYGHRVLLVFPTEEMRDAFYDNFKTLIESCKDLL